MSAMSQAPEKTVRASETNRAFEEAVEPTLKPLLSYFLRRVTPTEDAADCLSETLVVLWQQRHKLPTVEAEVRAWSFGIAKNVLANHRRGQMRQSALGHRLKQELATTSIAPPVEGRAGLVAALAQLKEDDRELVMLIAWDGFGVAEAGAHLGLKPEAARARYSRARARLRELLS